MVDLYVSKANQLRYVVFLFQQDGVNIVSLVEDNI